MELKQGYKQTDVGLIPEDWNISTLRDVCIYRRGSFPQPYGLSKWYDDINGAPFVQVFDIDVNWKIKPQTKRYISKAAQEFSVYAPKGTIVLTIQGSIGRIAITQYDAFIDRTLLIFESFRIKFSEKYFCLAIETLFEHEKKNAPGGIIKTITKEALSSFIIPIPSFPEQTAIATALSNIDELIAQTEKLIDKKKAIKQGVMQELLKPKEGWITKKFTDIVDYIHGKAHEQFIVDDGKFKVVNSKFISSNGEVVKYSNNSFLTAKKNDILTVLSDLPNGKALAKCFLVDKDNLYAVNQRVCIWRSKGADAIFLYYLLNRHKYFLQLDDGVTQTHILNGDINRFELTITEDLETQKEIGVILSEIDKEIVILEKKNDKLKLQKQGMMQALLTGKIRLL
jgi:type I restriction enzyme S subunit